MPVLIYCSRNVTSNKQNRKKSTNNDNDADNGDKDDDDDDDDGGGGDGGGDDDDYLAPDDGWFRIADGYTRHSDRLAGMSLVQRPRS